MIARLDEADKIERLAKEIYRGLGPEVYRQDSEWRWELYVELLRQLCELMIIDGGPTFGRAVLEAGCTHLRAEEALRGCEEVGPFLSDGQLQALISDPDLHLKPAWRVKR